MVTIDQLISTFTIYVAIFLAILVHFKNKPTKQKYYVYLEIFFFVAALYYLILLFYLKNEFDVIKLLFPFILPIFLLILPSFYVFLKSITRAKMSQLSVLKHFLPSIVYFLMLLPFYFFTPEQKINFLKLHAIDNVLIVKYIHYTFLSGVIIFINLQVVFYLILFIRILLNFNKEIEKNFSFKENINLRWVTVLVVFLFALILLLNFADYFYIKSAIITKVLFNFTSSFILIFLFKNAVNQKIVFNEIKTDKIPEIKQDELINVLEITNEPIEDDKNTIKYKDSTLKEAEKLRIVTEIENLKKQTNFFYDTSLNINALAKKVKTNTSYLSQIVNEKYNNNFFNFVNTIRVEKAVELINDPNFDKYTIEAIANLCGFNSRSSFYEAFKKMYKVTPSQYKKNMAKLQEQ